MKTALVFNNVKWGGKDVGDNSQFWERAEILSTRDGGELATVRFPDGRISHDHFVSSMREVQ